MRFFLLLSAYLCVVSGVQASGLKTEEFLVEIAHSTRNAKNPNKIEHTKRKTVIGVEFKKDGSVKKLTSMRPISGELQSALYKGLPTFKSSGKKRSGWLKGDRFSPYSVRVQKASSEKVKLQILIIKANIFCDNLEKKRNEQKILEEAERIASPSEEEGITDALTEDSTRQLGFAPLQEQNQEDVEGLPSQLPIASLRDLVVVEEENPLPIGLTPLDLVKSKLLKGDLIRLGQLQTIQPNRLLMTFSNLFELKNTGGQIIVDCSQFPPVNPKLPLWGSHGSGPSVASKFLLGNWDLGEMRLLPLAKTSNFGWHEGRVPSDVVNLAGDLNTFAPKGIARTFIEEALKGDEQHGLIQLMPEEDLEEAPIDWRSEPKKPKKGKRKKNKRKKKTKYTHWITYGALPVGIYYQ